MRLSAPLLTLFALYSAAADQNEEAVPNVEGDTCGVQSSDFLNDSFEGDYLVAGDAGCTLGEKEGCFCAPDFSDDQALSGWKWQCNDSVKFGPVEGKVCPSTIPLAKDAFSADILLSYRKGTAQGENPLTCDTSIHPTGRPGDEVCSYSDCDEGGDMSAICGCVDLSAYKMGEGQQWFCMQSTCSCGVEETPSSATMQSKTAASLVFAGISALAFIMAN